jgi:predicted dehydrogenase
MKTIRVGLAGCGFIGSIHARSLLLAKGSTISTQVKPEFVVVADADPIRAQTLARQYGWKHTEKAWEDLFKYDLDLVVVALPNTEHVAIVRKATEIGAAVLLEKPMAATYEEALKIYTAGKNNSRIRVGYINRFVPAVQRAKELVDAGELGAIRMIRSVYLLNMRRPGGTPDWRFDKEQAGHGASDDLGSHHIDLIQFLAGNVSSVQATSRIWDIQDAPTATNDDATNALLTLRSGAFGTLSASRTSPGHPLTGYVEIDGEKGALRIDRAYLNDLFVRDESGVISQRNVRPVDPFVKLWASPTVQGAHPFSWHDCFAFQMAEMLLLAADLPIKFAWSATLEDGIRAMSVTEAMMRAAQTGSTEQIENL